jgi:hypothetical protein
MKYRNSRLASIALSEWLKCISRSVNSAVAKTSSRNLYININAKISSLAADGNGLALHFSFSTGYFRCSGIIEKFCPVPCESLISK